MDKDKKLRKITQHVWNFISFKMVLTTERPVIKGTVGVNTDMIKLLRLVTWTGTYVSLSEWRGFVYEHYCRMITSPKLFATYVIYACYMVKQFSPALDAYQTFLRILSLVIQLALYSSNDRQEELLTYSHEIFIEFFEKELKKEFKQQGGWDRLGSYLQERNPLQLFKTLEKLEEEGKSLKQIVNILRMVPAVEDPLTKYLSRGIKESEVENYEPVSRILKSLSFLHEAKFIKVRTKDLHNLGETQGKANSIRAKSSEQDSRVASATGVDEIHNKEMFQRTSESVKTVQRITTQQAYIRAKSVIQDLRFDFQMLEELLEYVFGNTSPTN